jgi:hypothetical protein
MVLPSMGALAMGESIGGTKQLVGDKFQQCGNNYGQLLRLSA